MLKCRPATLGDMMLYFEWTNDAEVRNQSFNSMIVDINTHETWFLQKLMDNKCTMLLFEDDDVPIGQVRFQKGDDNIAIVGITVDKKFRGKGLATTMLQIASEKYLEENNDQIIHAFIKKGNIGSIKAFEKAGFLFQEELIYTHVPSVLYYKKNN